MKVVLTALNAQYMHVNLALRQIALTLPGDLNVAFVEGHINLPFRPLLERIAREAPDVVGFSVYIWNAPLTYRLCRALKAAMPHLVIFLGGPEVMLDAAPLLREHPEVDYILSGEGELTVAPLISALKTGAPLTAVPGLTARDFSAPAPPPLDPAHWPDVWADGRLRGLERRILYVETSRGCPYRCAYCLSSEAGALRMLPEGESVRRLTAMADAGATLIKLVDRTFNADRARANAIWRGLIAHARETGLRPTYHFEIGAHLLDDAAFAVLETAPAGLFQFEAGIQSSDEKVLTAIDRGLSYASFADKLKRVAALGTIHLHVDLIAGLPGETLHSLARSLNDACALGAQRVQLGFLKLLRGSGLRRDAQALGLAYEPDPPYEILSTPDLTLADLMRIKDIEHALDWYLNSGLYPCAVAYLLSSRTPYALFSELAASLRGAGLFDAEQGEKARAAALLKATDDPLMPHLVAHDLLSAGRRRDLPDDLAQVEDAELRARLREAYHPVRGQSARRYPLDVLAFARGEGIIWRETVVLYDAVK